MSEGKIPIRRPEGTNIPPSQSPQPRYPADIIELPTKGRFYPEGHPLANGEIEIKQITAREEDILANQDLIRKGKVLDRLLQSVLVNKDIDVKDILMPDKNAIFVAIRRLAYTDKYPVTITCPSCGEKTKVDIDLGKLKDKDVVVESFPRGKNEFSFTLPKSQIVITYKILNQRDDDAIEQELVGLRKLSGEDSNAVTTRFKHTITSVNGNSDKEYICKFVDEEFLASDARAFRDHMRNTIPDIDMRFDFKCPNGRCELERRIDIPVGASFLWPDLES